ncbi:hypothetical protein WR25_00504 [Diploscapter pachys]|uniref:Uncharacterized protein n=1 Tax=Diploscapter pachys TaxID=2018661 RepID=A0A2A2KYB6_9BILA|nr:hypothetical protein WR25_00504 [Diploscapter pachys]
MLNNCTSKDCTVHVIRVKLSQRPDAPDDEVDYKLKPRKRYGSNVYEVTNRTISKEIAQGIIKELPADTDPRLKDKLSNNDFFLRPVENFDESLPISNTIPPPPSAELNQDPNIAAVNRPHSGNNGISLIFTILLLAAGIILGVALTCIVLILIDHANSPTFDRRNAVIYKKASNDALARLENGNNRPETGSRDTRSSGSRFIQVHNNKSSHRVPIPPARASERRYIPNRDRDRRRDNLQMQQQQQQLLAPPTPSPRTTISTPDTRQTSL